MKWWGVREGNHLLRITELGNAESPLTAKATGLLDHFFFSYVPQPHHDMKKLTSLANDLGPDQKVIISD